MTQSQKFIASGVALCLFSSFGCAGTGLRNMFSRNETEGYKSLAELEAEDIKREAEGKDADSQGPRFASWLPFGKKSTTDSEAVASNDSAKESDETTKSGWWQNPFRKSEPIESDPFLPQDKADDEVVAKKEKPADRKSRDAIAAADGKSEKSKKEKDGAVKAVSKTSKTSAADDAADAEEKDEDSLLVEKFEKHFQQNTAAAVDAVDEAEPLIVAGKSKVKAKETEATAAVEKTKTATTGAASDKLAELERLLAEKKTLTAKRIDAKKEEVVAKKDEFVAKKEKVVAKTSAEADEVSDAFFETVAGTKEKAEHATSSFDSLFGDASANAVTANKPASTTAASHRTKAVPSATTTRKSNEVNVADADALFGLSPAVKSAKPASTAANRDVDSRSKSGGWSSSEERGDGFNWTQSQMDSKNRATSADDAPVSQEDRFAAAFAAARKGEGAPAAPLKDTPEPGDNVIASNRPRQSAADSFKPASRKNAIRAVSATRELTSVSPAGVTRDEFFAKPAPTPNTLAAAAPVVPTAAHEQTAGGSGFLPATSGRTWMLLVCGIIVAALLFAPGRKKPMEAMHSTL